MKIAVVGAGVIGVTSAVAIQKYIPNAEVTIYAELFSPNTTGDGSAGLWTPYCISNTDTQRIRNAWHYVTYTMEPSKFLPWLMKEFELKSGRLIQRKVENLQDLMDEENYDVIINCTGLGAEKLVPDKLVTPIRGQVSRVSASWIFQAFVEDDDNYVIPNTESVVLGGTHQEGDYDMTIRAKDFEFIHKGCCRINPGLKDAQILRKWTGLRPGRPNIRLEAELMKCKKSGKNRMIIHNYGHGGSGITLCWGCALNVVEILEDNCRRLDVSLASKL